VSRLHLLGSGRLLGSGALLLGNGEKREAGQNRKTDRPGNQVLSSHLTAPIQPHQKSKLVPQLLFHPQSKELAIGDARAEASIETLLRGCHRGGAATQRGFRGVSQRPHWAPELQSGQIRIVDGPTMRRAYEQLMALETEIRESGIVYTCPPGNHDDLGISCAMLAWAARHPHLPHWTNTAMSGRGPRRSLPPKISPLGWT
jgi:hypothetical protein